MELGLRERLETGTSIDHRPKDKKERFQQTSGLLDNKKKISRQIMRAQFDFKSTLSRPVSDIETPVQISLMRICFHSVDLIER
jgi:hypothetical protein